MNVRERLLTTLRGGRADRAPLVLPGLTFRTREQVAALSDPRRRALAERVFDHTVYRVRVPAHINRMLVTPPQRIRTERQDLPNGHRRTHGTIDTPKGELTFVVEWSPQANTSWHVKHPVQTLDDVERIASVPWELPAGLAPASADARPGDFETRGLMECRISTPTVCVAGMMPREMYLELCLTDRKLIEELTDVCLRRILDCLDVLLSNDAIEYVWIGGSEWVTPPMASPAIYDALVQEQERAIIARIRRRGGAIVHVHCHGRVRHALRRTIERGADYAEPMEPPPDGDITMAEAKRLAAGRITLGGNVECRVLTNESPDAVEAATRAAFEGGKRRFVLRPSEGPSPTLTEREFRNYMRMIDVWEALSPMDEGGGER